MKIVLLAVLALPALAFAGQSFAAPAPAEIDDLSIVTAAPRKPDVKPIIETARREPSRPEAAHPEPARIETAKAESPSSR